MAGTILKALLCNVVLQLSQIKVEDFILSILEETICLLEHLKLNNAINRAASIQFHVPSDSTNL